MKRGAPTTILTGAGSGLAGGFAVTCALVIGQHWSLFDTVLLSMLTLLLSLPAAGLALLLCIPKQTRAAGFSAFLGSMLFFGTTLTGTWLASEVRTEAFHRLALRSQPLVDALHEYVRDNGHPPATLADLVPTHIREIPSTSMRRYPEFEYRVIQVEDAAVEIVWYDLGSRAGQEMTGLWVYPDGDPDHAIMALSLDSVGNVVGGRLDRMPAGIAETPFDPQVWAAADSRRQGMARSAFSTLGGEGAARADVVQLLGEPSGRRSLGTPPWELRVNAFQGFGWDVFVYWPSEEYPDYLHGGGVERVGAWAYVHE